MTVRVAAFARIREIVGLGAFERRVAGGARAEDLWRELAAEFPDLAALRVSTRLVINGGFVDGAHVLHDGDELALLPPFGGG